MREPKIEGFHVLRSLSPWPIPPGQKPCNYVFALKTQHASVYPEPTIQEMLGLCASYGMVANVQRHHGRVLLEVLNEAHDLTEIEAAVMLKGLLLGYFYNQKRNDLTLAVWDR